VKKDAEWYFNEAMGRYAADYLKNDVSLYYSCGRAVELQIKLPSLASSGMGMFINAPLPSFQFGLDTDFMSINLKSANLVSMQIGVSAVFVASSAFIMLTSVFLAGEIKR